MNSKRLAIAVLCAGIFVIFKTQFAIPTLWEADGYYHIRMADTMRTQGVMRQLPWAQYSYFSSRFADKDFLYHVLLIPFTLFSNMFFGAKVAAAFFAVLLFLCFFFLLRQYCSAPWIPIFSAAFFASEEFLGAICRPRPMVLAIALMLLGIHFIIRKNYWGIFFTTFIYGFLHLTAPLMPVLALIIEGTKVLEFKSLGVSELKYQNSSTSQAHNSQTLELLNSLTLKSFSIKPFIVSLLALFLSYGMHPHFPNNVFFIYLNLFLVPYYAAKGGVLELGGEFFPMNMRDFLLSYPVVLPGILLLLLLTMLRPRIKPGAGSFETLVLFICSAPFLLASFLSQRYLIHGYPVLILWMGSYFSEAVQRPMSDVQPANKSWRAGCPTSMSLKLDPALREPWTLNVGRWTFIALLIFAATMTYKRMQERAYVEEIINTHYEQMGLWMRRNVPPDEIIFHANWSDSQYFIGTNPQNRYFVTLDPIYMYAWNPEFYKVYRDAAHGRIQDPYPVLKNVFKVNYGYAGKNYFKPLIEQIRGDPRFQIIAEDGLGLIFKLQ